MGFEIWLLLGLLGTVWLVFGVYITTQWLRFRLTESLIDQGIREHDEYAAHHDVIYDKTGNWYWHTHEGDPRSFDS